MEHLAIFIAIALLFVALFRVLLWGLGIDRLAKSYPGRKQVLMEGCWAPLAANVGSKDGWVWLLNWHFQVSDQTLYMNVAPQFLFAWLFPSLGIPVSALAQIPSSEQKTIGGWRAAFRVQGTKFVFRLPSCIAGPVLESAANGGPANA